MGEDVEQAAEAVDKCGELVSGHAAAGAVGAGPIVLPFCSETFGLHFGYPGGDDGRVGASVEGGAVLGEAIVAVGEPLSGGIEVGRVRIVG
ncbi:MAG TPA: hypothetical protein VE990_07500 [Acidimicrobiales bacterium]|nr:hypothetical protein [Acidimicrobiales bacterium]